MQRHGKTKNIPKYYRYSTLCSNAHRCAKCFPVMISSTCVNVQIACTSKTWWQNQFQCKGNSSLSCARRGDEPASPLAWSTDPGAARHQITHHPNLLPKRSFVFFVARAETRWRGPFSQRKLKVNELPSSSVSARWPNHMKGNQRKFRGQFPTIRNHENQWWEENNATAQNAKQVPKLIRLAKATCAEPSGRMRNKKLHPARNTFPSQNSQNTPCAEHFWEFKCSKIARRCGAKHVLKSAYLKTW